MKYKKKFGGGDNELVKVAKLKKVEQRARTIEKFIQEFRKAIRKSRYEKKVLVREFKRGMNEVIINIREKVKKEKNLRSKKEREIQGQRQTEMANNQKEFRPYLFFLILFLFFFSFFFSFISWTMKRYVTVVT